MIDFFLIARIFNPTLGHTDNTKGIHERRCNTEHCGQGIQTIGDLLSNVCRQSGLFTFCVDDFDYGP